MKFTFSHDIFRGQHPIITGEVQIKVTRTKLYIFSNTEENWEESEVVKEHELPEILHRANTKFGWAACDPKNEGEIHHRLGALLTHEDLRREIDDAGAELDEIETVVTLLPGSEFSYGYSHGTDEGYYSYGVQAYWNGENGWNVEVTHGGRDCDGNHSTTEEYTELVTGQTASSKTQVYDQFAQLQGY